MLQEWVGNLCLCFASLMVFLLQTERYINLKCLSMGTPKIINFPFVSNGKLMVFRCQNIQAHYNVAELCLNLLFLGVPILKHIRIQLGIQNSI